MLNVRARYASIIRNGMRAANIQHRVAMHIDSPRSQLLAEAGARAYVCLSAQLYAATNVLQYKTKTRHVVCSVGIFHLFCAALVWDTQVDSEQFSRAAAKKSTMRPANRKYLCCVPLKCICLAWHYLCMAQTALPHDLWL